MNLYCIEHNEQIFYNKDLCIIIADSEDEAINILSKSLRMLPKYDANVIESLNFTET